MWSATFRGEEQACKLTVHVLVERHCSGRLPKRVCAWLQSSLWIDARKNRKLVLVRDESQKDAPRRGAERGWPGSVLFGVDSF